MNPNPTCDPGRIAALLSGEMNSAEQSQLEAHIETCQACQDTLADSASDIGEWTAAARHLLDDEHDGTVSVLTPAYRGKHSSAQVRHAVEIRSTDSATAVVIRQIIGWLDPTDDPRMLGRLGGYEIAGVIGSGGMGVVLKGFDASLNRFVAIKLLAPHLAGNGASRQRFAREAQAAAAVVHENVIAIHSVSEFNDLPYLVMPYVRGMSLQKRIDVEGPMELEEVLRIGMQTASGLAAAHAQGLVHRDIKPANILLNDGVSRVTITDFGLARAADDASLTHSGLIAGTPQYMSPEQASGKNVDHRSDLYSLGSVLYAMCAGRPPFRAESAYGVLKRIAEETARPIQEVNPKVPDWLGKIIAKLHSRHPDSRFQSATEVERLLADCLAHVQQPTRVPLPQELTQIIRPRLVSAGWATVAATLLAATAIGVVGWQLNTNAKADPAIAQTESPQTPTDESVVADTPYFEPVSEPQIDVSALRAAAVEFEFSTIQSEIEQLELEFELNDSVPSPEFFEPGAFDNE